MLQNYLVNGQFLDSNRFNISALDANDSQLSFSGKVKQKSSFFKMMLTSISYLAILIFGYLLISVELLAASQKSQQGIGQSKAQKTQEKALTTLKSISKGIQSLKTDVVTLNKDLRLVEEKLLFPSSTKYSVFVSTNSGQFFTLESVKLKLDGRLVATHIYSDKQRQALSRGGIQKLYITNLNSGKHSATVFFTGVGPNGRAYKLANTLNFDKGSAGEYLELSVRDDGEAQEPYIVLKQW